MAADLELAATLAAAPLDTKNGAPGRRRTLRATGLVWPLAALAMLLLVNLFLTPGFFHVETHVGPSGGEWFGTPVDILRRASPTALVALGMTLVIATGGVDLSVGAVMAIAGAVAADLIARPDGGPLSWLNLHGSSALVVVAAVSAGLLCGAWNGVLVSVIGIQPIVATLILMVAGRGVAQLLTAGQIVTFQSPAIEFLATGTFLHLPFVVTEATGVFFLTLFLTRGTALGLFLESVGNNAAASRYAGVNARAVKLMAYVFAGACAAYAGLIVAADTQGADANNAGLNWELDAILAVCLGGTALTGGRFSLVGAIIGALIIQTLKSTILQHADKLKPEWELVVKALVIVAVCLLQSEAFRQKLARPVQAFSDRRGVRPAEVA